MARYNIAALLFCLVVRVRFELKGTQVYSIFNYKLPFLPLACCTRVGQAASVASSHHGFLVCWCLSLRSHHAYAWHACQHVQSFWTPSKKRTAEQPSTRVVDESLNGGRGAVPIKMVILKFCNFGNFVILVIL